MELKYYIGETEITEPIGFDNFKILLERGSEHGIGAVYSVDTLEFIGTGYSTIKAAYEADLDTSLPFSVKFTCSDDSEEMTLFEGVIDLSTYLEKNGDYCSCSCNVGEVGIMTTFNNRVETILEVGKTTSLDGDTLTSYDNCNKNIVVPAKSIKLTATVKRDLNSEEMETGTWYTKLYVVLPMNIISLNEFGEIATNSDIAAYTSTAGIPNTIGNTNRSDISITFDFKLQIRSFKLINKYRIGVYKRDGSTVSNVYLSSEFNSTGYTSNYNISDTVNIGVCDGAFVVLILYYSNEQGNVYWINTLKDTFASFSYLETMESTNANISLVHETLSNISEQISGLTVKSDYYGRYDSEVNPIENGVGDGALKSILNGFKLRNFIDAEGKEKPIYISFKDLFLGLKSIDNIGWGFNKENTILETYTIITLETADEQFYEGITFTTNISEILKVGDILQTIDGLPIVTRISEIINEYTVAFDDDISEFDYISVGTTIKVFDVGLIDFIRIENWKWFYQSDVIFTIDNPTEKVLKLDAKKVYSRAKIGYAKYETVEDVNSVDTFYTERNYTNKLKAIDNEYLQVCKFIADPYAIEFTRRKALEKSTQDWKYDENIFIVLLNYNLNTENYTVDRSATGENVIAVEETYNARISPLRNLIKHSDIITQGFANDWEITSGTGNMIAKIQCTDAEDNVFVKDEAVNALLSENATISGSPFLKAETIECEYPLSLADYETIRETPYGTIQVDGEDTFLKKLEYNPFEGKAKFTLIPKA